MQWVGAGTGLPLNTACCCRVWDSLRAATRARTLVLFYKGRCLLHVGAAAADAAAAGGLAIGATTPGPICQQVMQSGTGNYLANLMLFPGGWAGGLAG